MGTGGQAAASLPLHLAVPTEPPPPRAVARVSGHCGSHSLAISRVPAVGRAWGEGSWLPPRPAGAPVTPLDTGRFPLAPAPLLPTCTPPMATAAQGRSGRRPAEETPCVWSVGNACTSPHACTSAHTGTAPAAAPGPAEDPGGAGELSRLCLGCVSSRGLVSPREALRRRRPQPPEWSSLRVRGPWALI